MHTQDARDLIKGDELFVLDGVGRISKTVATYEAGPFDRTNKGIVRSHVMLIRLENGELKLYNLTDLAVKPPVPKVGETYIHRVDGHLKTRYVDGVVEGKYVVTKSDPYKPDSKAHLMTLEEFVKNYKRKP